MLSNIVFHAFHHPTHFFSLTNNVLDYAMKMTEDKEVEKQRIEIFSCYKTTIKKQQNQS
jgi:hypothetical protein